MRRVVGSAVGVLWLAGGLAGCTGATPPPPEPEGTFAAPTTTPVTCLEHQPESPGPAYTGGADGDTAAILGMLRYWAANGSLAYCDGEPATEIDQQWRDLVEQLGATRPPDPPGSTSTPGPTDQPPATPSATPTST